MNRRAREPESVAAHLGLPAVEGEQGEQPERFEVAPLFTDFCAQLGVHLEPGQRVAARVCYDGLEPRDLEGEERQLARLLFGDVETLSPEQRKIVVGVAGARGGKTYVLVSLRLLHLALTVDLSSLAPGQVASGPIIAPDMDLATEALRYIQGAIASQPSLASMVDGKPDAAESIELVRDGKRVEIVIRSASGKGRTGRGRSLFGAAMEETAQFHDDAYKVNDREIFRALTPRILPAGPGGPGGQILIWSTPWTQLGLLYDLFVDNFPDPSVAGAEDKGRSCRTAIAVHATTLTLRNTELTRAIVKQEEFLDKENAEREYGARFMGAGAETFFDPACIAACVDENLSACLPSPGDEVTAGADLGFAKNSSALAVAHLKKTIESIAEYLVGDGVASVATFEEAARRQSAGGLVIVGETVEHKPQEGARLKPSEVCAGFADTMRKHGARSVSADGHYRETFVEHLGEASLGFIDAPPKTEVFIKTRTAMREGRVRIPNNPRLVRQLRETVARRRSGGTVEIVLPRWKTGEHGDLAEAVVQSVYQIVGEKVKPPPPPAGSPEANAAQAIAMREKRREEVRRKHEPRSFSDRWPGK